MREGVAELMPPVLADDLTLVYLIDTPQVAISFFVQENSLEYMVVERDFRWELGLVVGAVETHFEL